MIDYHTQIVAALSLILPTHYEMVLCEGMATPCISYLETNNYVSHNGEDRAYSQITYQIKIWDNDIATIQSYVSKVDKAMRELGFVRISSGELYDTESSMIQKIMTYRALGLETFDEEEQ